MKQTFFLEEQMVILIGEMKMMCNINNPDTEYLISHKNNSNHDYSVSNCVTSNYINTLKIFLLLIKLKVGIKIYNK